VTLTDAATIAIDWTAGINFTVTITTNRILGNPTNEIPGTWRTVFVISDGGPDELTFGSEYGGTPPTLDDITTTKGYLLSIYCRATSQVLVFAADGRPAGAWIVLQNSGFRQSQRSSVLLPSRPRISFRGCFQQFLARRERPLMSAS